MNSEEIIQVVDENYNKIIKYNEDIKDCFYISLHKDHYNILSKEFPLKQKNEVITYKNIPVLIGVYNKVEIIPNYEKVIKVYEKEILKFSAFKNKYEKLCNEYNIFIDGCGCCGSPYLNEFYTFSIDNFSFRDNKLKYKFELNRNYEKYIKKYLKKLGGK